MNTTAKNVTPVVGKTKKTRKPPSARRVAAEQAVTAAKSDQEKTVARSALKIVRFDELATPRVRRAVKAISSIANLANRGAYTYTDEQAKRIELHISNAVSSMLSKFKGEKAKQEEITI
jgi:hypothetical protein